MVTFARRLAAEPHDLRIQGTRYQVPYPLKRPRNREWEAASKKVKAGTFWKIQEPRYEGFIKLYLFLVMCQAVTLLVTTRSHKGSI